MSDRFEGLIGPPKRKCDPLIRAKKAEEKARAAIEVAKRKAEAKHQIVWQKLRALKKSMQCVKCAGRGCFETYAGYECARDDCSGGHGATSEPCIACKGTGYTDKKKREYIWTGPS